MKPLQTLACGLRLFLFANFLTLPLLAADTNLKDDLANLQGKWKATVTTDDGNSIWTLVVKGNKSNLVIESKDGDPVFKGELDFKLEKHGSFKAYTYWNLKILSGDKEGETQLTDGKTKSSLYKLDADTFTTISGFREEDEDKPILIKWEKVPDVKK
jgi:hypothetical protein